MNVIARAARLVLPAVVVLGVGISFAQTVPSSARLEDYLQTVVRLTAAERQQLRDGAPVTKFLDADPNNEVALFGAIWINATSQRANVR